MAKNLRPCNFITKVDGKEKSMSFDQMREYLLANPDVWMPASTRKIGGGKMQASMGGREVTDDFKETIAERLGQFQDRIKNKEFPLILEVAEAVLPKSIFKKYQALYEMAARNGITVDNEAPPFGTVASYGYNSVQLYIPTIKEYTTDYEEFAETLNHEIIHGLLHYGINNRYQLFTDLQSVMKSVEDNFDKANDEVKNIIAYIQDVRSEYEVEDYTAKDEDRSIGDLEELITYAFTNTEFAKFLDSIPASKDIKASGKTIFDQLKDIIRTFIQSLAKGPTALDEVNEALNKYFDVAYREEDIAERNEKYGWGLKFEATKSRLQASEGGRGEGPAGKGNKDIKEAIIQAGKAYRSAGNSRDAAISAGVKYLKDKGMTEEQAYDAIVPLLESMIASSEEKAKPGSFEDPAGWIKIGMIPQDVLDTINIERTTMQATLEIGMNAIRKGEINPRDLAKAFAEGVSRPLTATETAALVAYKVSLGAQLKRAYEELEKAKETTSQQRQKEALSKVRQLEGELENYYITSRKSGYEMGLAFRTRQLLLDNEYNIIDLKQRYRANYGPVPSDVSAEWESLNKQKEELAEREKQLIKDREDFEREKAIAGLAQEVEQKKKGKDVGAAADSSFIVRNLLNNMAKIPSIFSRKPTGQASAGLRAGEQSDGEYIWTQAISLVADTIGKKAKPEKQVIDEAIKKGVDYIKSTKWYKQMSPDEQKEAVTVFTVFAKQNTKAPGVKVDEASGIKISHETLRKYTEQVLEDNPLDKDDPKRYEKLMKAVSEAILNDMASELPVGTSWEDIRDAITKYGQTSHPSQEDLELEVRRMKEVGRKMAQLEAVLSGNKPLKSGYQRDPQSDEARRLVEQINEGLKKLAISEMDSEAFLRSSLDRIKKNLQNQIADLDLQIKEGKRRTKEKSKVEYDEEATTLKELRDLLKSKLDEIDPKDKKISAEQQLNNLINGLERSILEYQRRIAEKDFSAFKKAQTIIEGLPQTAKYKELLEQRNELRKQLQALKKGPEKSPLEKRIDALQKEYDSLLDGTYEPKKPPVKYDDPRLNDLREKIKDLKKQMGLTKSAEEVKLERLRKQLSDLLAGNIKNKPAATPDSPEATALKQQIQDVKDQMGLTQAAEISRAEKAKAAQLRKVNERIQELETNGQDLVGKPKVQSALIDAMNEEIKERRKILQQLLDDHGITIKKLLAAEKERVKKIIEEKEERIAKGYFGPKVSTKLKLTKADYDQEMKDIVAKRQAINEKYEEAFYRAELANRSRARKFFDLLFSAYDIPKSAVSGLDMSAPLRQGLFEVLSQSPVTTAKAFKLMFESAFSGLADREDLGKKYEEWLGRVKASPEYQVMKAAGLYLAEETTKGRAAEDAFANRLMFNIPLVEKPIFASIKSITGRDINPFEKDFSLNLYKRSELAYNAFLNYMRVAAFTEVIDSLGDLDVPITFESNPEEFKAIADVINISTGRPSLGGLEAAANAINKILFSLRLVWSRFLFTFLPAKAAFMPPAARKYAMVKYMRAMGSLAGISFLMYLWLANDDDDESYVEFDPRGGFLKMHLGADRSIDLTAGIGQWVTFLSKLITSSYKKRSTGEIRNLGEGQYDPTWLEVIAGFIAGKAAPTPRLIIEYKMSKENKEEPGVRITEYGERYDILNSLGALAVPLIIGDVAKASEKSDLLGTIGLGALAFFGGSVNVRSDSYKLPSEIMSEGLHPGMKEYRKNQEKMKVFIENGKTDEAKKLFEKQIDEYIKQKNIIISQPDMRERVKAQYILEMFNGFGNDKLLKKTGLNNYQMRQAFFMIMSGKEFAPLPIGMNPDLKEKTLKARQELVGKFLSIPEATRINIIQQYARQAKEREKISDELNKFGIKYNGQKINWMKMGLDGTNDWYYEFEFFKNSPNFKKYLAEIK